MSIQRAEQLKKQLTDKFVVVDEKVPELRRFSGLTGTVKTVNMNCRALVQFDGPEDISWYDIEPSYLTVVDKPLPKQTRAASDEEMRGAHAAPAKKVAPAATGKSPLERAREQGDAGVTPPAAEPGKKLSPLEQARMQGAAGAKPSVPPASMEGTKKPSPLELARQQGAAKAGESAKPTPQAPDGKKLSPLELARMQGAAKAGGTAPAPPPPVAEQPVAAAAEPAPAPAAAPPAPAAGAKNDDKSLSPLERARLQGPAKR